MLSANARNRFYYSFRHNHPLERAPFVAPPTAMVTGFELSKSLRSIMKIVRTMATAGRLVHQPPRRVGFARMAPRTTLPCSPLALNRASAAQPRRAIWARGRAWEAAVRQHCWRLADGEYGFVLYAKWPMTRLPPAAPRRCENRKNSNPRNRVAISKGLDG